MPAHQHGLTVYAQNDPTKRSASPAAGNGLASPATFAAWSCYLQAIAVLAKGEPFRFDWERPL